MSLHSDVFYMTPQEVDFYAEDYLIHIIPNFTLIEKISLISVLPIFKDFYLKII